MPHRLLRPSRLLGGLAVLVCASTVWAQQAAPVVAPPPVAAAAAAAPKLDTGDTAWMLVSTALVLMMTIPGLALFYGGLVRSKNVLSTFMHSLFCAGIVSVLWVVIGYSIAFGSPTQGGWCGGLSAFMLKGVLGTAHPLAPTIPHILFVAYQLTFAIITPALISGAYAERIGFKGFVLFTTLWSLIVYAPLAHWVWGGGWIGTKLGALDFAGGTVVHISSGISALVCALYLGKRAGYGREPMPPHNLPFTVIGAGLLWVGWFGFNAGSALGSNELASVALLNTHVAAAAAALAWLAMEMLRSKHATLLGAASGAVAGLVVITPAAGFVSPGAAIIMGLLGGGVCYSAVSLKPKLGYDDALDVVGVHFVGGTLGAILTGVFASKAINPAIEALTAGGDIEKPTTLMGKLSGGLVDGSASLLLSQSLAVVATVAYCGVATLVILFVVNFVCKLRPSSSDEILGMDLSQHRERAYALGGGEAAAAAAAVLADPKPASAPPTGRRFAILVDGVPEPLLAERWRGLCSARPEQAPAAFLEVYRNVTTLRGCTFRFHGADPEATRAQLQKLFQDLAPTATARVIP